MNKIVASFGIAALGASTIHSASAQDFTSNPQKPWAVSATLRGFYDDNLSTTADGNGVDKIEAFGIQVSPGIGLNWEQEGTSISLGYRYTAKIYDHRPMGAADKIDNTHEFRAALDHAFNERYRFGLSDSFVIGQEPDVLRADNSAGVDQFQRLSGDNIRNYASIFFNAQLSPLFSAEIGYNNTYADYDATFNSAIQSPFTPIIPSSSGALDRVEHTAYLEGQYQIQPETLALLGYQFGVIDYTGDELIGGTWLGTPSATLAPRRSDDRNSRSHYAYLGVSHSFSPDFTGSVRAGAQFVEFYNDPNADSEVSPYVQAVLNYTYAPESYLRFGFTQRRSAIYNVSANDADTSAIYASIYHRIVPNLFGSVTGTFQNSMFNGGINDGDSDQLYQVGVNLAYYFTKYLSADVGYNYDHLESDVVGRYSRNRVYIGVTATY